MMSVFNPCITWVPILWGQLLRSINKSKGVGDTLPDLLEVDNPLSDDLAIHNPLPDLALRVTNNRLSNLPAVKEPLPDLPYHIVVDILSRLPVECVFQCQCVSRPLNVLTTTPFFTQTHHNRADSVIVLQSHTVSRSNRVINLYFIDEKTGKIDSKSMKMDLWYMNPHNPIVLSGSYDGFILFRNIFMKQPLFLIWNPITEELVTLTSPRSYLYVCGFYFHALKKKYEVFFLCQKGKKFEFLILTLGTKSWRHIGNCFYPPYCERPPVIINGTLYWMVDFCTYYAAKSVYPSDSNSILSFRIETEEFSTIEFGGCVGLKISERELIHLFEMEGKLWLCDPIFTTKLVLWVLNHTTMCWVEMYVVILPGVPFCLAFPNKFCIEVAYMKKGKLLVRQRRRLLLYNLDLGTVEKEMELGIENDNYRVMVHSHSLFSLQSDRIISLPLLLAI